MDGSINKLMDICLFIYLFVYAIRLSSHDLDIFNFFNFFYLFVYIIKNKLMDFFYLKFS
jgi:hypothetical protein